MGDTSDGDKNSRKKQRQFSLQNDLSQIEINKIIGVENFQLPRQVKTYLDKVNNASISDNTEHIEIPGRSNKIETSQTEKQVEMFNEEVFDDPTIIFKARASVSRTPPPFGIKEKQDMLTGLQPNDLPEDIGINKRPRSENSPTNETSSKRQCGKIEPKPPIWDRESNDEPRHIKNTDTTINTENIIFEIFASLEKIQESTNKCKDGIVTLSTDDQNHVRSSSNSIHKGLTLLVYKLGLLEKENLQLKYQSTINCNNDENKPTLLNQKVTKTYARAMTQKPDQNLNSATKSNNIPKPNEEWKTPKTTQRYETLIRIENVNDSKSVADQLKKNVNVKETNGGFKNIRHLKSGAIIVESHNKTQQEQLKKALQTKTQMHAKEFKNSDPMFLVTGIEKGFSDQEFVEEIIRLNSEIETELGYKVAEKIKVVAKKPCRNITKENWILQSSPDVAKWFLKKKTINFDFLKVYVQEHFNMAICFRCSGFGHVAKYCSEKQCCSKCGQEHASNDCTAKVVRCPNCIKLKINAEESHHSARDVNCPVYKRRLERYKNQINYNTPFLQNM